MCFCTIFIALFIINRSRKGNSFLNNSGLIILAYDVIFSAYITLLLSITILGRTRGQRSGFSGMWTSISLLLQKNESILYDVISNIILFVPYGFLLGIMVRPRDSLILVISTTIVIEIVQLITNRGLFEIGDVLFNVLGGLVGICCYISIEKLVNKYAPGLHLYQ